MKNRFVIFCILPVFLFLASLPALADEVADLKATNDKYFNAWNASDVETFTGMWIDGGAWLADSRAFPIPVRKSPGRVKMWTRFFETHIINFTWYNPQYLVIGNTGLVWGLVTQMVIDKAKGTGKEVYLKMSVTYVNSEGEWKVALLHSSPIPSEREIF